MNLAFNFSYLIYHIYKLITSQHCKEKNNYLRRHEKLFPKSGLDCIQNFKKNEVCKKINVVSLVTHCDFSPQNLFKSH